MLLYVVLLIGSTSICGVTKIAAKGRRSFALYLEEGENMKISKLTLLVVTLALVLGICSSALAQVMEEHDAQEPPAQEPPAQEPPAQQPPAQEPPAELSCQDIFRAEQAELGAGSAYPTSVSEEARACEESGEVNPYPAPYFYDSEGFLYAYDPVADRYTAPDPVTGLLYIYDIVTDSYYTYDPATGSYV
jgi:hypothetical protein